MELENLTKSRGFFQFRYEGTPQMPLAIIEAARVVQDRAKDLGKFSLPIWNPGNPEGQLLRNADLSMFWGFSTTNLQISTLYAVPMIQQLDEIIRLIMAGLDQVKPAKLSRCGFALNTNVDLGMTHPELVESMFGTLTLDRDGLGFISNDLDDLVVQLYGKNGDLRWMLQVMPQTEGDARLTILTTANLELFKKDKHSPEISDYLARISKPSLFINVDVFQEGVERHRLETFIHQAVPTAVDLINRTISKVMSLPLKVGR